MHTPQAAIAKQLESANKAKRSLFVQHETIRVGKSFYKYY